MAPIHNTVNKLKERKILLVSVLANVLFLCMGVTGIVAYRQQLAGLVFEKIFENSGKMSSYHIETYFNFSSLRFSADFVSKPEKWKQAFMHWNFKNREDSAHLVFNKDDMYLKLDSSQFRQYVSDEFKGGGLYSNSPDFIRFRKTVLENPFVTGKSYLLFDKKMLDGLMPDKEYEKEVTESGKLVNEQIVKSLRLRGIPSIQFIYFKPALKIPLSLNYQKLNSILYPSVKSFAVKDQKLLAEVFDKTTLDIYVNMKGEIIKMVAACPPLSKKQIAGIFDDKQGHPANIFWQLNDRIVGFVTDVEKNYVVTIEFTEMNKPVSISPPKNSVRFQDMMNGLIQPTPTRTPTRTPTPIQPKSSYVINNAFAVKSTGKEVDSNFFMIHNMLYRYYSDHGAYPSSLDLLAGAYFPGMVPGNPQTAQGFSYSTFENGKGYMLCPAPGSAREYCHKKYLLDEVN